MKRLRSRMFILILFPTILFLGGMIAYIANAVYEWVKSDAEQILESRGSALSSEIQVTFEQALRSTETLSQSFQGIIAGASTPNREHATAMLQQVLNHNPDYYGAWMVWEPDAFDGRDEEYVDMPGHDGSGRFMPYLIRSDAGGYDVEPLDWNGDFAERTQIVKTSGKSAMMEPYWYKVGDELRLMTSVVAPVMIDGKTVGMTGVDILLEQMDRIISQYVFYETGFAAFMSNDGHVISHKDKTLLGQNYYTSGALNGVDQIDRLKARIQNGELVRIQGHTTVLDEDSYFVFSPVKVGNVETHWAAMIIAPIDEVMAVTDRLLSTIITASVVVLVLLAALLIIVTENIVKPIRLVARLGKGMADGDFTQQTADTFVRRKDEIGDLNRSFAAVGEKMRGLISRIQEGAGQVLQSANTLDEGVRQSSSASREMAAAIQEVARSAESQMQGAEESARSMEDMTRGVQTVAGAASSVSGSAAQMKDRALTGQEAVHGAVQQMQRINQETSAVQSALDELQAQAAEIESIVGLITGISEQTNLLALNAAIEAARAGEAGRGFAVVANQVRKLADESKHSATEIQHLLERIGNYSDQATASAEANQNEVKQGIVQIEEVGRMFDNILESVKFVVGEVEELSAVAEEMSAGSQEMAATSEEIAASAEVSFGHTQQVAAASEQQLASMEDMATASESLKKLAHELSELLVRFKV